MQFIIPCISSILKLKHNGTKVLAYQLDKGYFQSDSLEEMCVFLESISKSGNFKLVGAIDKIRIKSDDSIKYRQRLYFYSFDKLLILCEKMSVFVGLSEDFHIRMEQLSSCHSDLPYMTQYARKRGISLDKWLRNAFILQLGFYMRARGFQDITNIDEISSALLKTKGYCDRAPLLAIDFNRVNHTIGLAYSSYGEDSLLFTNSSDDCYSDKNLRIDRKRGILK